MAAAKGHGSALIGPVECPSASLRVPYPRARRARILLWPVRPGPATREIPIYIIRNVNDQLPSRLGQYIGSRWVQPLRCSSTAPLRPSSPTGRWGAGNSAGSSPQSEPWTVPCLTAAWTGRGQPGGVAHTAHSSDDGEVEGGDVLLGGGRTIRASARCGWDFGPDREAGAPETGGHPLPTWTAQGAKRLARTQRGFLSPALSSVGRLQCA